MNMDGIDTFADTMRQLVARVDRLELVTHLLVAPIREAVENLTPSMFCVYMDKLVSRDRSSYTGWKSDLTHRYVREHDEPRVEVDLSGMMSSSIGAGLQTDADRRRLVDALLIVAAIEEFTPRELLMEVDSTVFDSVVDALAAIQNEEETT